MEVWVDCSPGGVGGQGSSEEETQPLFTPLFTVLSAGMHEERLLQDSQPEQRDKEQGGAAAEAGTRAP